MTGWCGTLELTTFDAEVAPEMAGFTDLGDLPDLVLDLMEQRKRRVIQ